MDGLNHLTKLSDADLHSIIRAQTLSDILDNKIKTSVNDLLKSKQADIEASKKWGACSLSHWIDVVSITTDFVNIPLVLVKGVILAQGIVTAGLFLVLVVSALALYAIYTHQKRKDKKKLEHYAFCDLRYLAMMQLLQRHQDELISSQPHKNLNLGKLDAALNAFVIQYGHQSTESLQSNNKFERTQIGAQSQSVVKNKITAASARFIPDKYCNDSAAIALKNYHNPTISRPILSSIGTGVAASTSFLMTLYLGSASCLKIFGCVMLAHSLMSPAGFVTAGVCAFLIGLYLSYKIYQYRSHMRLLKEKYKHLQQITNVGYYRFLSSTNSHSSFDSERLVEEQHKCQPRDDTSKEIALEDHPASTVVLAMA